jgi:hypothetical protein
MRTNPIPDNLIILYNSDSSIISGYPDGEYWTGGMDSLEV